MSEMTAAEWMCTFMCPEPEFDCPEGDDSDLEEFEGIEEIEEDPEMQALQEEEDYLADQGYSDEYDREIGIL